MMQYTFVVTSLLRLVIWGIQILTGYRHTQGPALPHVER